MTDFSETARTLVYLLSCAVNDTVSSLKESNRIVCDSINQVKIFAPNPSKPIPVKGI